MSELTALFFNNTRTQNINTRLYRLGFSLLRLPKGFKAPGLRPKKCRAPGLQDGKFGALGLHCFPPGLHLAKKSIFVRAPNRERLWAPGSTTKLSGLQGSKDLPFGLLVTDAQSWSRTSQKQRKRQTRYVTITMYFVLAWQAWQIIS